MQESYTTAAIFACDVGYSLLGANNVTCQTDGTWSDVMPTCVACQSLTSPSLGNITLSTDGMNTYAQFACTDGYKVLGDDLLSCLTNSSWDSVEPTCICEDPEAPAFGQVTVDDTGMLASYTCDVGYTMDGERTRDCQLDSTSWTGDVPSCVTCTDVPSSGANITLSTNGTQTTASFSCLPGYTMIGEVTSECSTTGIWTPTAATCVSCDALISPASGNVSVTSNGTVSVAEYTCNSGYTLSGVATRTCQEDGSWDGQAAQCDCEELTDPVNGNLTMIGQTAYYACAVNYTLSGEFQLVCQEDGTGWSNTPPTCAECQSLQDINDGSITFTSVSGLNTTAQHACDIGYTLVGFTSRTCNADGTWDGSAPYCQLCDVIQSPNDGAVTLTTNGSQTIATFTCDVGYTVNDVTIVTSECDQSGVWESTNVECISCEQLTNISSGATLVSSNGTFTTASYSCVSGYDLVGVSTRTCLSTGTWSDTEPRCKCETPDSIPNGSVAVSFDGMKAFYTCDSGYSMNGVSNITCQEDGSGWDYASPSCVKCETLTTPDSGTMTLSFTETSTQALLSCVSGYYLNGQNLLTCGQNGTWDYETPVCVCEIPASPANGNISVSVEGFTITYSCDIGHSLNGAATRTCQNAGQSWSGSAPSCVSCDTVPSLLDGNIEYSSNGTVTELSYSCNVGYTLYSVTGETSATCDDDGTWNTAIVSCVECDTLSSPSSGSLLLSTDGLTTSAYFDCATDYYMVGENSSVCDTSGVWTTSAPSCLCVLPTVPTNGAMTLSDDNLTLTLACDVGYILSVSAVRTCSTDGTGWSGVQPTCGI
ncbi:CUB and sushi domain-containing protein 3-like [Mercenaria mercenaria]|uniref:CUB and sushi domain-containing protein 3-like n=1 Tax=Mercenaria mercenaria TaxID=6596 RepID=UPI00234F8964|nr:CUB and sushi domain-containing protein 3-like [Mercenaria mercenaria]